MLGFNVRKLLLNEEHGAVRYKGHGSKMGAGCRIDLCNKQRVLLRAV